MTGIPRADIARAEELLYKIKLQLISMDAVPGGANAGADGEQENAA